MNKLQQIYPILLKAYGRQGWWPIVNNKTMLCEYGLDAPRNNAERFEICVGCILAQNTGWYPNVVRAVQQLKLGRQFTKEELEEIREAEMLKGKIFEKPQRITGEALLTQNTAWPNVERTLNNLKLLKSLSPNSLLSLDEAVLKTAIRPAGYFNQKARKLREFAKYFKDLTKIPSRTELLLIWGIGPETADSILLYAFKNESFVVDAYTKRIFSRLGLIEESETYDAFKAYFELSLPKSLEVYQEFHALIVEHAKRFCKSKPECAECPLIQNCEQKF